MWITVSVTLLINTIIMAITYIFGRKYGLEDTRLGPKFNLKESTIVIYGSLLQQSNNTYVKTVPNIKT
jgi:hypothetical protein